MSLSPLAKKLKLEGAKNIAIINAPDSYFKSLGSIPQVSVNLTGSFDWIQIFVKNKAELDALLPKALKAMAAESRIWISFPKGTSKIQTDLTRDKGWGALRDAGLRFITLISVNDTWSAFNLRTYKPGEERQAVPWTN